MAQDRTSGYDMLVQISESEINTQIATAFLTGSIFPTSMSVPINVSGITGTANLNFLTPIADFDRPRPQMGLTVPFQNSELVLNIPLAPNPVTISPLGGTIVIADSIEMITVGSSQIATMDFNNGAPQVTVDLNPASEGLLTPLLPPE